MTLYEIVSLITPPIIMKALHKCFRNENSERYIKKLQEKNLSTIGQIPKQSDQLFILGNGPSLKSSLEKYGNLFKTIDCLVVNQFCTSEWYEIIKPRFYMFVDPAYFLSRDCKLDDGTRKIIDQFVNDFVSKTKWTVYAIIPSFARNSWIIRKLIENKNINIMYINFYNFINDKTNSETKFLYWDKNLLTPLAQTVLHTCLFYGIFKRYCEIYILGADTNPTETYHVDQETNELFKTDEHFYGTVRRKISREGDFAGTSSMKFYEMLDIASLVQKNYWELKEYAEYANVKVYNASEYSLIDAFERRKPDELMSKLEV